MAYNASQTKKAVHYDLKTTPFTVAEHGLDFHFSSVKHAEKFGREALSRVEWLNDSMTRRFHIPCKFDELALFQLYQQIEGRGFCVYDIHSEVWYHSAEEVKLFIDVALVCD